MSDQTASPPVKPDYELAKALYISGLPMTDIAERVGVKLDTLWKRASRYAWKAARQAVSVEVKKEPTGQADLGQASSTVRKRLSDELVRVTADLATLPVPKSAQSKAERLKLIQEATNPAKILYNWGEQTTSVLFNMALIDSVRTIEQKPTQVLDVESVTTQPDK